MDSARIQALLPWRYPFLMIDRMLDCTPHEKIATIRRVTASDPAVNDAGAAGVWLPAVLMLEGINQSAALLYALTYGSGEPVDLPLLGFLSARMDGSARVGESLRYEVCSQKMTRAAGVFLAEAHVGSRRVATAEVAFSAGPEAGEARP